MALTEDEAYLRSGVRGDAAVNCAPRREDLPPRAIAGIECTPHNAIAERVGVYLFPSVKALIATYSERMKAEGLTLGEGGCFAGEGEANYIPGDVDVEVPYRHGCFVNEFGIANYRATLPDQRVYLGVLGTNSNTQALADWAWEGMEDVPGTPTVWLANPR